jgi:hypothetical protein
LPDTRFLLGSFDRIWAAGATYRLDCSLWLRAELDQQACCNRPGTA